MQSSAGLKQRSQISVTTNVSLRGSHPNFPAFRIERRSGLWLGLSWPGTVSERQRLGQNCPNWVDLKHCQDTVVGGPSQPRSKSLVHCVRSENWSAMDCGCQLQIWVEIAVADHSKSDSERKQ